jgi:hypothetical protein
MVCVHVPNCAFVPARWSVSMPAPNVSVGSVAVSCPVSATEELELVIAARPALEINKHGVACEHGAGTCSLQRLQTVVCRSRSRSHSLAIITSDETRPRSRKRRPWTWFHDACHGAMFLLAASRSLTAAVKFQVTHRRRSTTQSSSSRLRET